MQARPRTFVNYMHLPRKSGKHSNGKNSESGTVSGLEEMCGGCGLCLNGVFVSNDFGTGHALGFIYYICYNKQINSPLY